MSKGLLPTEEALVFAARGQEVHGKGCWAMPLAMAQWLEGRYSVALASLVEPSVIEACDSYWIYHNLVGMVARKIEGEIERATKAYERSLELDPNRPDTLYNFANLLKDDDPDRAILFYRKSLTIEPCAASAWHNYGTALNNLDTIR